MANGKQLSQKVADFILDLMDSYIDVKEAVTPCVVRGDKRMTEEEFEKEKCELLGIIQGKDKAIAELEKENADLKEVVAILQESAEIKAKEMEYKVSVIQQRNGMIDRFRKTVKWTKELVNELACTIRDLNNPSIQLTDVDGYLKKAEDFVNSYEE